MEKKEYRKNHRTSFLAVLSISCIISFFSLRHLVISWNDYNSLLFKEFHDMPLFSTIILGPIGFVTLIIAIGSIREYVRAIEPAKPKKDVNNFSGLTTVKPYSPNFLKSMKTDIMVFDYRQNKILIGKTESPIGTFTKIPYSCVMDYEIVSDKTVIYKPTLGGVIMWGSAATKKKKSTINNVTIKIYARNISNTVLFPILTNENINNNTPEFTQLQSLLDKFVREMKLIERDYK